MTKHLTALALAILTAIYVYNKDFTVSTTIDYAVSVMAVILFSYMYSRLMKQTKEKTDETE